jgi:hypothetical protein
LLIWFRLIIQWIDTIGISPRGMVSVPPCGDWSRKWNSASDGLYTKHGLFQIHFTGSP